MIFLSGTMSETFRPFLARKEFGLLIQPRSARKWYRHEEYTWAADNGCFTHPGKFDLTKYIDWLASQDLSKCLFATAPDVPYQVVSTLEKSAPALPLIRELGVRAALVAQDGLTMTNCPWSTFECFFVGGTTEFKFSMAASRLCLEAKRRGKWVHIGRINSEKGIRRAIWMRADSVDGNYLKFAPDGNVKKLVRWFRQTHLEGMNA